MIKYIIYTITDLLLVVAVYLIGKYSAQINTFFSDYAKHTSKVQSAPEAIDLVKSVSEWADAFVHDARQNLQDKTGSEKMEYVIKEVSKIINVGAKLVTDEQIRAIAQKAYDEMKNIERML